MYGATKFHEKRTKRSRGIDESKTAKKVVKTKHIVIAIILLVITFGIIAMVRLYGFSITIDPIYDGGDYVPPVGTPNLYTIDPNPDYDGNIFLNWSEVEEVFCYKVYRSKLAADASHRTEFVSIATIQNTEYNDFGLSVGTYFYKIETLRANGSVFSREQSVKVILPIPPEKPDIRVSQFGDEPVKISWIKPEGALYYKIYRSVDKNTWICIDDAFYHQTRMAPGGGLIYKDSGLDIGTYYYKIQAVNDYGDSDFSNIESVYIGEEIPEEIPEDGNGDNILAYVLIALLGGGFVGIVVVIFRKKLKSK